MTGLLKWRAMERRKGHPPLIYDGSLFSPDMLEEAIRPGAFITVEYPPRALHYRAKRPEVRMR